MHSVIKVSFHVDHPERREESPTARDPPPPLPEALIVTIPAMELDKREAELFFHVLTEREEKTVSQ